MTIEKYYNEAGEVAVLYSPGYGAGWSSWCNRSDIIFDKRIVQLVLDDKREEIDQELLASFGYGDFIYCGGARDLVVEWMKPGTIFDINEYDGNESIRTIADLLHVA